MTDIPQEALDALMEIEAEAVAKKLGLSLVQARDVVKELLTAVKEKAYARGTAGAAA